MVCGRELAAKALVYSRVPDLCSSEYYMNSPVKLWFSIKLIAIEYFSKPFNCWMAIFNSILKIRQNRFGETWEKLSIKIFNFHHRTPNVKKITNSDSMIIVCFLFFSEFFFIANVFWVFLFFFFLKCQLNGSVFRLDGFAQVTQPLVCLHILFSKFQFFFYDVI